jgi:hypothetical protein
VLGGVPRQTWDAVFIQCPRADVLPATDKTIGRTALVTIFHAAKSSLPYLDLSAWLFPKWVPEGSLKLRCWLDGSEVDLGSELDNSSLGRR